MYIHIHTHDPNILCLLNVMYNILCIIYCSNSWNVMKTFVFEIKFFFICNAEKAMHILCVRKKSIVYIHLHL